MVVRFENIWIAVPMMLIVVMFVVVMMVITRIWMFGAPKRERKYPQYSLHVMYEPPPKHIQRLQNTTPSSDGLPGYAGLNGQKPAQKGPKIRPLQPQPSRSQAQGHSFSNTGYATPPYNPRSQFI